MARDHDVGVCALPCAPHTPTVARWRRVVEADYGTRCCAARTGPHENPVPPSHGQDDRAPIALGFVNIRAREAVIVDGVRTPVGRRGGVLSKWHPVDLLADTLRNLLQRDRIDPALIDDVIVGCVLQEEQQAGNIGRHAVLAAGFPESVPAVTVDRQCGSGQQAVSFAAQGVVAGGYDLAVACGVESMSRVPVPAAMIPGAPLGPHYSPRELARYRGRLMMQGPSSDLMNREFEISRAELDAYSAQSHDRAFAASPGTAGPRRPRRRRRDYLARGDRRRPGGGKPATRRRVVSIRSDIHLGEIA